MTALARAKSAAPTVTKRADEVKQGDWIHRMTNDARCVVEIAKADNGSLIFRLSTTGPNRPYESSLAVLPQQWIAVVKET